MSFPRRWFLKVLSSGPALVFAPELIRAGENNHKTVSLIMAEGEKIDRLQVLRFSTPEKASLGGFGEPVYAGNWFFGMDYPGFYSRHSDGYREPDYYYRWNYMIDLEGKDKEYAPGKGLITLFHYPGYAEKH